MITEKANVISRLQKSTDPQEYYYLKTWEEKALELGPCERD